MKTQKTPYLRPAKKRYAFGNNWKQIHLPLPHELYYGQICEAIDSNGNIYTVNTTTPNNDLIELSVELQSPLHMNKGKVRKIEMKRQLSFYPSTETFEFITAFGEQDQQKVGIISQKILGSSIKYERRIEENEEEKQLRERNAIKSIVKNGHGDNIWLREMYDSLVERKPNEIELRCKRAGISDIFGMLSCGLIPCLKHVLKFYDVHNPKDIKLVRNQYQRTIDYNEDVLSAEEAILIANASDWITVANCKAACSQSMSYINHSQKYDRENGLNWIDPEYRYEHVERIRKANKYNRLEQMRTLEEAKNFIDLEAYSPEKKRQDEQQKMLEELDFTKEVYEMMYSKYGNTHKI